MFKVSISTKRLIPEFCVLVVCSQVNIDDHAKHEALVYTEQHDYISLSLVRKGETGKRDDEAEPDTFR